MGKAQGEHGQAEKRNFLEKLFEQIKKIGKMIWGELKTP